MDLDGDGDLDVALSRRPSHGFYWYERKSDSEWIQHTLSESPELPQSLGAAGVDVDRDGWTDLVFSQVWFRNPGTSRESSGKEWSAHRYRGGGHDILGVDVNGDGSPEVVVFDGEKLVWFSGAQLERIHPVAEGIGHHGGLTPKGAGDLDGDGDIDIVSKIWNKDGPTYHADYWRNDTRADRLHRSYPRTHLSPPHQH